MTTATRAFKHRAFVSLMMVFSGLTLPVTGIANHVYGFAPLSVERHAWMSAHNALGQLFVVFSIWHVVLNRKALWNHMRNTAAHILGVSHPGRNFSVTGRTGSDKMDSLVFG
jgi:hypothetical protein